jgi:hypothetical protein
MRRWLINILSALSLLLCIAIAVVWVRSYYKQDDINIYRTSHQIYLSSYRGAIVFELGRQEWHGKLIGATWKVSSSGAGLAGDAYMANLAVSQWQHTLLTHIELLGLGFLRFQDQYRPGGSKFDRTMVRVPHWSLLSVSAPLPLIWLWRRHRQQKRPRLGLCPSCGYDLRATPNHCPECGHEPSKPSGHSNSEGSTNDAGTPSSHRG